jgi:hypothetical protein
LGGEREEILQTVRVRLIESWAWHATPRLFPTGLMVVLLASRCFASMVHS